MPTTVVLVGAGFSCPFGYPVMRSFFDEANRRKELADQDRTFLRELRKRANEKEGMYTGDRADLEHVLSFATMDFAGVKAATNGVTEAARLRTILAKVFGPSGDGQSLFGIAGALRNFLGQFLPLPGERLVFITTNYDCLLEYGLWQVGTPAYLPFDYEHIEQRGGLYDQNNQKVVLCKLHGSVNWFRDSQGSMVVDSQIRNCVFIDAAHKPHDMPLPAAMMNNPLVQDPLIVPPTYFKQVVHPAIENCWSTASTALRSADRVVVVGYSFPETDTHMKYFLAAALADNTDLSALVYIDPMADQHVAKMRAPANRYGSHFLNLVRPVNKPWQNLQLEEVLRNV